MEYDNNEEEGHVTKRGTEAQRQQRQSCRRGPWSRGRCVEGVKACALLDKLCVSPQGVVWEPHVPACPGQGRVAVTEQSLAEVDHEFPTQRAVPYFHATEPQFIGGGNVPGLKCPASQPPLKLGLAL